MYLIYGILICFIHYAVYFDRQTLCYTHICMHMRRYVNNRYIYGIRIHYVLGSTDFALLPH